MEDIKKKLRPAQNKWDRKAKIAKTDVPTSVLSKLKKRDRVHHPRLHSVASSADPMSFGHRHAAGH